DELKVFQGYKEDGTFRPTETLNRAQAAVLVYRIATGDVEDKYLDNYTYMQQSKFTDLDGYNWAKGYINYCQNAGIVVGTSSTTFEPGKQVTGYQLLVMLLRTLGYGKAGEFANPDGWELKSAEIAESEGITKNVTFGDFGAPAPRQMVAEILFRGLLTETVQYSALVPGGYTKSGETLGKREFGLEQVSGVVMANQWANLEGDSVAKADTTVMKIDDKNVTVNKATDLDAVGLTYNAYIANGEGSTKRALTLEKSDVNVVAFNEGAGMDVSKLAKDNNLNVGDAEYYLNYAENWSETAKSDWLIRYVVSKASATTNGWTSYLDPAVNNDKPAGHKFNERTIFIDLNGNGTKDPGETMDCWEVSITKDYTINKTDLEIMEGIFDTADYLDSTVDTKQGLVFGEVYAGTSSLLDRSDVMSWNEFVEEFLDGQNTNEYEDVENGNSLRIVDNNGDGKAEYVLRVDYTQDKAIGERRDVLQFNKLVISKYEDNNLAMMDEIAVGDVINYTIIDGKLTVYKADMITDTIHNKNFKNVTVDATDEGETHGQSEIDVYTNMETNIMLMAEKTSYNIYFDEFGYIRSYELAQGTQYALLTEMYTTGTNNWNYVSNADWIAEVKIADADIEEMNVANTKNNAFISNSAWTSRGTHGYFTGYLNFLQPAIAHLGNPGEINSWYWAGKTDYATTTQEWGRTVYQMNAAAAGEQPNYGVFNYGPVGTAPSSFSFTNVAAYTADGEDISLTPATRLSTDTETGNQIYRVGTAAAREANDSTRLPTGKAATKAGLIKLYNEGHNGTGGETWFNTYVNQKAPGTTYTNGTGIYPVYAIDYVQLTAESVKAGMRHFTIDNKSTTDNYGYNYNTTSNNYVNANDSTVFYVVEPDRVTYFESYKDLPTIKAEDVRAAYAVATNTNANADGLDYWVGDVIVIETTGIDKSWDSIALAYANPYETSGATQYFDTLNNEWRTYQPDSDELAKIGLVPDGQGWSNATDLAGRAFYEVYGTDYENGELTASIKPIKGDWNGHGIYAGTIRRVNSIKGSGYIDVDTLGRNDLLADDMFVKPIDISYDYDVPFYRISNDRDYGYSWDADTLDFAKEWTDLDGVRTGDQIIWVTDKDGDIAFVVDLGSRDKANGDGIDYTSPTWLTVLYASILAEQTAAVPVTEKVSITAHVGVGTTLKVSQNGTLIASEKNDTGVPGDVTVNVLLDEKSGYADLNVVAVKTDGTYETLTFVAGNVVSVHWSLLNSSGTNDAKGYTIRLVNNQIKSGRDAVAGELVLFTQEYITELVKLAEEVAALDMTVPANVAKAEAVQEALDAAETALTAIKTNYTVLSGAGAEVNNTTIDGVITDVSDASDDIDQAIEDSRVNVTVTGIAGAVADPVSLVKGSALAGQTITIKDAEGETLTTATLTSVTMSELLTEGTDYTYANGVITFKGDKTATTNIDILAAVDTPSSTYTVAEVTGFTSDVTEVTEEEAAEAVTITLTGKDGTTVAADDVIVVKVGNTPLTADTDYTATVTAGEGTAGKIVIAIGANKITGNVTITVTPAGGKETAYTVAEVAGFTSDVTEVTEEEAAEAVTITLTGKDGTTVAADDVIVVKVGNTPLTADTDYTATVTAGEGTAGKIVIAIGANKITDNVTITVTPAGN
ncbi:MAG: S-layer homology domain-containing protein, partial [Oscillospiraceae bacterium]|nr:S-layer homology domain-containing protein [Oscillospiraceae bacterium]